MWQAYCFIGLVCYHHCEKHDRKHSISDRHSWCWRKKQRFPHLNQQEAKERDSVTGLNIWNLKAHSSDIFSIKATSTPTRQHLLKMSLSGDKSFKHMSLWGQSYSNNHSIYFSLVYHWYIIKVHLLFSIWYTMLLMDIL